MPKRAHGYLWINRALSKRNFHLGVGVWDFAKHTGDDTTNKSEGPRCNSYGWNSNTVIGYLKFASQAPTEASLPSLWPDYCQTISLVNNIIVTVRDIRHHCYQSYQLSSES